MVSSPEADARRRELEREAPVRARTVWKETVWDGKPVCLLCGTLGADFDRWQRRLSVLSAADAYLSQQIGLDVLERQMDAVEGEARAAIERTGRRLRPRRSPGYGDLPLALSREILARLDATRTLGVSLTGTDLLVPSKSVTAICEITP
ncbi:MAG: hypothetical protein ACI4RD_06075 [Kiritimatiellia bacterium]